MPVPLAVERPGTGLLLRWVVANGLGELVGLGGVGLLAAVLVPVVRRALAGGAAAEVATAVLMVVLGAVEGWVVGHAQARALASTGVDGSAWVRATMVGAMLAWALGMVPSTVMALRGGTGAGGTGEGPPPGLRLVLAAALGLVAGPVLAVVQAQVLRHSARKPARWLLANALGWAVGMPLVFVAVRNLAVHGASPGPLAGSAATLLLAGALVGLVEGLFLVRLLRSPEP